MSLQDQQKQLLRNKARTLLDNLSHEETQETSLNICKHVTDSCHAWQSTEFIAVFSAHKNEPDLSHLHQLLQDKKLCYPRCLPNRALAFHQVTSPTAMTPGTWGIKEPNPNLHPVIDIKTINLFLCPGLVFGRDGSRLGHGAGYYDRALSHKSTSAHVWGVCFDIQLFDTVPNEPHDQALDGIITESGITLAKQG